MCLALTGCAGFWDDVTSRDFRPKEWFVTPNPLVVLRDSDDGDRRAKAFRTLQEPKQHGGTDQDQEFVVKILTQAAVTERQPLCRLAAIEALGHFQDPRAVSALKDAYFNANNFPKSSSAGTGPADSFFNSAAVSSELVSRIRCQALASLGQTGNPAAVEFLVRVLNEPPSSKETAEGEKQQVMDRRIAAARALGNFKDYQTIEALVRVVQTEKDVALLDRAHESLEASIGRKLPADPKDWDSLIHPEGNPNAPRLANEPAKPAMGVASMHSN
jgi:HEAT repeats/PBS lyase HEAT-like repeat